MSTKGRILIVDDEPHILKMMTISLRAIGYEVVSFEHAEEALKEIDRDITGQIHYDLAFVDLMMFPLNGIGLMQELHRRIPDLTVVIITAHGTVETAVSALKMGAYDYLQKPFDLKELTEFVERVRAGQSLRGEHREDAEIITVNATYLGVLRMAERIASSNLTVLVEGETGTGKELLADFIHKRSDRSEGPIVKLNCAALTAELVESELFGHSKGAFTGAIKDRIGRVEAADQGTLFLDEIGEMPIGMQAKLLRFLQSKEFQRVGENETRQSDVRIIAATNRNLEEAIANGSFREDLFYRLSGVRLMIPPLRLRKEDILPLAQRFISSQTFNGGSLSIPDTTRKALLDYDWRGNVRELENTMLRAAVLAGGRAAIELTDLPEHIGNFHPLGYSAYESSEEMPQRDGELKSLEEVEKEYISFVIGKAASLEEAAKILKIDSATLWRKRKKYGL